jgi:hypothetical protein
MRSQETNDRSRRRRTRTQETRSRSQPHQTLVIIPPDFSRQINGEKQTEVQVLVDGTNANNTRVIKNGLKATTNAFMRSQSLLPKTNPIATLTRLWFNPGPKESLLFLEPLP